MKKRQNQLRITEIFHSIQGESATIGLPTVFIRLTGCPLRCQYCDSEYAFHGGQWHSIDEILQDVAQYKTTHVCVTGGEPLAQPGCMHLLARLCDNGYNVSIETSGALSIEKVDPRVTVVMDIKTPDSKESARNMISNLDVLKPNDQIKFVLCSEQDYLWAVTFLKTHRLDKGSQILFSPSWGQLEPTALANWIVRDKLQVRFQLQLHKILWDDKPGY